MGCLILVFQPKSIFNSRYVVPEILGSLNLEQCIPALTDCTVVHVNKGTDSYLAHENHSSPWSGPRLGFCGQSCIHYLSTDFGRNNFWSVCIACCLSHYFAYWHWRNPSSLWWGNMGRHLSSSFDNTSQL